MGTQHRIGSKADRARSNALLRGVSLPALKAPAKRQKRGAALVSLILMLSMMLALGTTAFAAPMVAQETVHDNGKYTVFAIDEAGNIIQRNETIDYVDRNYGNGKDYDKELREYFQTDQIKPVNLDEDENAEDIVASLVVAQEIGSNGKYTYFIYDEAGNFYKNDIVINRVNIAAEKLEDGKDETGNIVTDDLSPEDIEFGEEDIVETMKESTVVTSNGTYSVFVIDGGGNLSRRDHMVKNANNGLKHVDPDDPSSAVIITPDITAIDSDEDYTEEIKETDTAVDTATSNGYYCAVSEDMAGNLTFTELRVKAFKDVEIIEEENEVVIIKPEDIEDTEEDYTEDILNYLAERTVVTESGIYAAVARNAAGLIGVETKSVAIETSSGSGEPGDPGDPGAQEPETKVITFIRPDTDGSETDRMDGSERTDTLEVFENGYYAIGPEDNVGNVDFSTYRVRNIGAPDVIITANPESLTNRTAPDGSIYGEAVITFKVDARSDSPLASVAFKDDAGNSYPIVKRNATTYAATVTQNGKYFVAATDINGREGDYPVVVDYIFSLDTQLEYSAIEGESISIAANVINGRADSFQWYRTDEHGNWKDGTVIPGATTAEYEFTAAYTDNDSYFVVAATRDQYTVASDPIHVTVFYPPRITAQTYRITSEGATVSLSVGDQVGSTFRVTDAGNPTEYSYQWYYATSANAKRNAIIGATSATYSVKATADMDGYFYFVELKTDKWTYMSDGVILQVYGAPTAPRITGRLTDGTIIPDGGWAIEEPMYIELGRSEVSGSYDVIKYYVSTDNQETWSEYLAPIAYNGSQEGTKIYAKAVNTGGVVQVDSPISEHTINIELDDPFIPDPEDIPEEFQPDEDEIVRDDMDNIINGVNFKQNTWTNKPVPVKITLNNWSGISDIKVFFKAEGEAEYTEMTRTNGSNQYQLNTAANAEPSLTSFIETKLQTRLWRATFLVPENGYYYVQVYDRAGRGYVTTAEFEVTHIDYAQPLLDSITLSADNNALMNDKYIIVTGAQDAYSASKYKFSQADSYAMVKSEADTVDPNTIDEEAWVALNSANFDVGHFIETVEGNGIKSYDFDIHIRGNASNGRWHLFIRDIAGNFSAEHIVEIRNMFDKMENVRFGQMDEEGEWSWIDVPDGEHSLTIYTPDPTIVDIKFDGQAASITAVSDNGLVINDTANVSPVQDYGHHLIYLKPVDYGTANIAVTLRDYDGTTYCYTLHVTVKNMYPRVATDGQPNDANVNEGENASISTTINGANLTYEWFYTETDNGPTKPINELPVAYRVTVNDVNASTHTVTLSMTGIRGTMDGYKFWVVAKATEARDGTADASDYTLTTAKGRLGVLGPPALPASGNIITATDALGTEIPSGDWTHTNLTFTLSGVTFPVGTGEAEYEYRYDGEREYTKAENNTFVYDGADTHGKKVYVRGYNKWNHNLATAEVEYVIRKDTVAPSITVTTGDDLLNWRKDPITLTVTLRDTDSGITNETANVKAKAPAVDTVYGVAQSQTVYRLTLVDSGYYTIKAYDVAGNVVEYVFEVTNIDNEAPMMAIEQSGSDGTNCVITIRASDNLSVGDMIQYSFRGGEEGTFSSSNYKVVAIGTTLSVAAKDAANNIARKTFVVTGENGGNVDVIDDGGAGGALIETTALEVDGFTFGRTKYVTDAGIVRDLPTYNVGGNSVRAYRFEFESSPTRGGVLYGYVSLSSGERLPVYWDEYGTKTKTADEATAYVYLAPEQLTKSMRSGTMTINIGEYEDETLSHKLTSAKISAKDITIDVTPPSVRIALNQTTMEVTVTTKDSFSDVALIKYRIQYTDGAVTDYADYVGPFTVNEAIKRVTVYAEDAVGNGSETVSSDLSLIVNGGSGSSGVNDQFGEEGVYYYRSSMFNFWLIGSNKNN